MIPEVGHFALILAFVLSIAQAFFGLLGSWRSLPSWMEVARPAAAGQWVFVVMAFGCLMYSFLVNDFSVLYVASNSNSALPIFYRVAAVWGAHEGSLLLWITILASWTLAVTALSRNLPQSFASRVLGVLGIVSAGFMLFTLATSNPFERMLPAAVNGADLNPILQDPALAIHPPMLYTGYVGFAVAFAFACAALIEGKLDQTWARWTRPWTVAAWVFLTCGIALGSWWAYYELGWGGWWFWDPVENASFMPWLVGTALIHSLSATEKRGIFKNWTLLLSIFAFSLSLMGTFLVRSGVLVSVHTFATDPGRGLFMLAYLVIIVGGSMTLFAWRAGKLYVPGGFELWSREFFLLVNNVLLVAAAGLILWGTLSPLIYEVIGAGKISVGPPVFAFMFFVPMIPLLFFLGIGMHASWRRNRMSTVSWPVLRLLIIATVFALLIVTVFFGHVRWLNFIGFAAGIWIALSSLLDPIKRWRNSQTVTRATVGMAIAHFGVGIIAIGISGAAGYSVEKDIALKPSSSYSIGNYQFTFVDTRPVTGPNYSAIEARIAITRNNKAVGTLRTQKRQYWSRSAPQTAAGIDVGWTRDLFAALGEDLGHGTWSVRLQYKPFVRYIWMGALVMAIGGIFAASDRRYRIKATSSQAMSPAAPPLPEAKPA
jgi:cytochrome c-type biogenesis protein CcmF